MTKQIKAIGFIVLSTTCLCSCGGGSSNQPAQPPAPSAPVLVTDGRYTVASEAASLIVTGDQAIFLSKSQMGFGSWNVGAVALTLLARPIDDLGNEFPAAHTAGSNRTIAASAISPDNRTAPDLASIPRNWRFANLYRFGGQFLDYTLQIDIDTAGTLSGFDINGCNFSGQLLKRTDSVPLYDVRIISTACGATAKYIENAEYQGVGYVEPGAAGARTLVIVAVNVTQQGGLGVAFSLSPR